MRLAGEALSALVPDGAPRYGDKRRGLPLESEWNRDIVASVCFCTQSFFV